jgi:hypothetical protein
MFNVASYWAMGEFEIAVLVDGFPDQDSARGFAEQSSELVLDAGDLALVDNGGSRRYLDGADVVIARYNTNQFSDSTNFTIEMLAAETDGTASGRLLEQRILPVPTALSEHHLCWSALTFA